MNNYFLKYKKYKKKYLKLQKGGVEKPLPKSKEDILSFIKELTMYNIDIRLEEYEKHPGPLFEYTIDNIRYLHIAEILSKLLDKNDFLKIDKIVFSKGINRIYKLIDLLYILSTETYSEKFKVFIVAQFIILNQVFSDGNHRSAMYVLNKYGNFNEGEIKLIMEFTERIHKGDEDLQRVGIWKLDYDGLLQPEIKKLLEIDISYLFN